MKSKLRTRTRALAAMVAAGTVGLGVFFATGATTAAASAKVQSAASENWAGYVAGGKTFSSVSGSWTEPAVAASTASNQSYSAVWVGLGGSGSSSSSLEQIGTGADYVNGQAQYYAWYELLPTGQVRLNLAIHPGDKISARVSVSGTMVSLHLSDATTGQSVNRTLQMSNPDASSAEWIVEAPAAQTFGGYQVLPLADFSKVTFSNPSATAAGHTGGISDSNWSATRVQLTSQTGYGATSVPGWVSGDPRALYQQSGAGASTSTLTGDSFAVSWQADSTSQATDSSQPGVSQHPVPYPTGDGGYGQAPAFPGGPA